jgi:adenylosuccinate lyase
MGRVHSEDNKFQKWILFLIAVLKVRRRLGEFVHEVPENLIEEVKIDPEEINRIEASGIGHDVMAFLKHVTPQFPEPLKPLLHLGLTSYDVGDTTLSLQLQESVDILIEDIDKLMQAVKKRAIEHKYTPEIGRTHGIHAEPITFGIKLANWYAELKRHRERLIKLHEIVSVGKISGAVGAYTLDPKIEKLVCQELGLKPIIATQIISRDIVAEYMSTLGIVAATIGKISVNIRLLSQTEIGEVMEPFGKNQKGSSAMPHKKNPIGNENLSGLMRVVCANVQVAYENLANCWHERSIDNSSAERVTIADSSIALDYGIARLTGIIEKMRIFPDRMLENIGNTKGLIFSQEVMMLVAEKSGLPRNDAHSLVGNITLDCWEKRSDFLLALFKDKSIMQYVDFSDIQKCFNLENKLKYVDYIFENVFGDNN